MMCVYARGWWPAMALRVQEAAAGAMHLASVSVPLTHSPSHAKEAGAGDRQRPGVSSSHSLRLFHVLSLSSSSHSLFLSFTLCLLLSVCV